MTDNRFPWLGLAAFAATMALLIVTTAWFCCLAASAAKGLSSGADRTLSVDVGGPSGDARPTGYGEGPFMGLGDLPGGLFSSSTPCISADGSVVVGYSNSASGLQAFRWTRETGMVGLGFVRASGMSADGSVVVGFGHPGSGSEAIRWTLRDGKRGLGKLTGLVDGEALSTSADGSVVVGSCGSDFGREAAFRWTEDTGMVRLGQMPGVRNSTARGVSADGSVIVGSSCSASGDEAFRWTRLSGMTSLGSLPGDFHSAAYAVSADGSIVVGVSGDGEAFRWSEDEGMIGLGVLPGGRRLSFAEGVSADGTVVVGQSSSESGLQAFIWDAVHGMRSLHDVLLTESPSAAELTKWKLRSADSISADGRVVAGTGTNPYGQREAWVATVPSLPVLSSGNTLADGRMH